MNSEFYKKNRGELFELLPAGSMAVFYSGTEVVRSGDDFYPFAVDNNFYYLTGIREPDVLLALVKSRQGDEKEVLFIHKPDEEKAKWVGAKLSQSEAVCVSDIDVVEYFDRLEMWLKTNRCGKIYLDQTAPAHYAAACAKKLDCLGFITPLNSAPLMTKLRNIKKPEEIAVLKDAIAMTADGLALVRENLKPGMKEYEIQALFEYVIASKGAEGVSFETIVASGKHGTTLHYVKNNDEIAPDVAVLLDCGAKYLGYCADISRTYPSSGRFTDKQAAVYTAVLNAQEQLIPMYRSGVSMATLQLKSKQCLLNAMVEQKLCAGSADITRYYYHGIGHPLGLDTHDLGRQSDLVLRPGMVITCEPGLYLAEDQIGVRIEDDILITDDEPIVLSKAIPKSLNEMCK